MESSSNVNNNNNNNNNNKRQRTGRGPSSPDGLASAANALVSCPPSPTPSRGQGSRRVWARDRLLALEEHLAEAILDDLDRMTEGARRALMQIKQTRTVRRNLQVRILSVSCITSTYIHAMCLMLFFHAACDGYRL